MTKTIFILILLIQMDAAFANSSVLLNAIQKTDCASGASCYRRATILNGIKTSSKVAVLLFALKACELDSFEGCVLAAIVMADSGHNPPALPMMTRALDLANQSCKHKTDQACTWIDDIKDAIRELKMSIKNQKQLRIRERLRI